MAENRASSSAYDVSMRHLSSGIADRRSRHTSTPSPSGSLTSSTATSGLIEGTRARASWAVDPSPTTVRSSSASKSSRRPRRTTSWSSRRNTLVVTSRPPPRPSTAPFCLAHHVPRPPEISCPGMFPPEGDRRLPGQGALGGVGRAGAHPERAPQSRLGERGPELSGTRGGHHELVVLSPAESVVDRRSGPYRDLVEEKPHRRGVGDVPQVGEEPVG